MKSLILYKDTFLYDKCYFTEDGKWFAGSWKAKRFPIESILIIELLMKENTTIHFEEVDD